MDSHPLCFRSFICVLLRARYAERVSPVAAVYADAALQSLTLGNISRRRNDHNHVADLINAACQNLDPDYSTK